MSEKNHIEFDISVTATPRLGKPQNFEFSSDNSGAEITGSTIPIVAKENVEEAKSIAEKIINLIKKVYPPSKDKIEILVEEEEEIDRGWFSHSEVNIKLPFDGGTWQFETKSVPKKVKRTKKTKISLKEK